MIRSTLLALSLASAAAFVHAAPVAPSYTTFGNLAGATYGGNGIPTDPSVITTANGITVGMIAHQRYANAALGNDNAGTYYATTGLNDGLEPGQPHALGATWNFGFYVNLGTGTVSGYQIELLYDLNPAAGTDSTALGVIDLDAILIAGGAGGLSLVQDTQNLNFAYLSTGAAGVTPPGGVFNPNAAGEYSFVLRVSDQAGRVLSSTSMLVNVVPEPGSLALAGVALLGMVGAARRRKA